VSTCVGSECASNVGHAGGKRGRARAGGGTSPVREAGGARVGGGVDGSVDRLAGWLDLWVQVMDQ
jgi:hypothetical protein